MCVCGVLYWGETGLGFVFHIYINLLCAFYNMAGPCIRIVFLFTTLNLCLRTQCMCVCVCVCVCLCMCMCEYVCGCEFILALFVTQLAACEFFVCPIGLRVVEVFSLS